MSARLVSLRIDADDPRRLADFWAGVLGGTPVDGERGDVRLRTDDDPGFDVRFAPTDRPKVERNLFHFDLTSTSLQDQQATVDRALALGATPLDVGQGPEDLHVVLADPEGNEFCVIEPGNRFLEGCGAIGALSGDGTEAVGRFWAEALGWPLVWDQDEETAVQSPDGGTKITWGGPPLMPWSPPTRVHLDLAGDDADVERLVALGATRLGDDQGDVLLADPDGREFWLFR